MLSLSKEIKYKEEFISSHRTKYLFSMLHVCHDNDFVNMKISFLRFITNVFSECSKNIQTLYILIWHIYNYIYLNTSPNITNLVSFSEKK